jgi:hypothetical protein
MSGVIFGKMLEDGLDGSRSRQAGWILLTVSSRLCSELVTRLLHFGFNSMDKPPTLPQPDGGSGCVSGRVRVGRFFCQSARHTFVEGLTSTLEWSDK